ncbi:MAG TPA: phosphate ABC transporter permease PstA [Actinomycetota bacterium]|nr:phosphate ABC transporter permease PstA [Actinomycetota bacterium]
MSAAMSTMEMPREISSRRRTKDRAFSIALWACVVIALVPLLLIVYRVVRLGLAAVSVSLFAHTALPASFPGGGMKQAFLGTGMIVGLAVAISIPLGVLTGIYLSEYGSGRVAGVVRFTAEILLSIPSIVAGAFIWALVVVALGNFSALAAGIALTVLMWPIMARATEEVLRLVPTELREGGLALGYPRWRVILRIVLPTAGAGVFTAIMLAVARGLGETAPVLLTALGNDFVNTDPLKPTDAVPLRVYNYAQSAYPAWRALAWGGALMLLVGVLVLSVTARVLSIRQQRRMR